MGTVKKTGEGFGIKQRDTAAEGLSPLIPIPTCVLPSSTSGFHFPGPSLHTHAPLSSPQSLPPQGCAPGQTAELVLLVQRLQHPSESTHCLTSPQPKFLVNIVIYSSFTITDCLHP